MIFNLVEAAQEFLSEIVPVGPVPESVSFICMHMYCCNFYHYSICISLPRNLFIAIISFPVQFVAFSF